jgi:hypothetical protein
MYKHVVIVPIQKDDVISDIFYVRHTPHILLDQKLLTVKVGPFITVDMAHGIPPSHHAKILLLSR